MFSVSENGIEHPQSTGWLYLHGPQASQGCDSHSVGRDWPHSRSFLVHVGGNFSLVKMLTLVNLLYMLARTYPLPVDFCIYLIKWTVYLRILRIPHYDIMVGWCMCLPNATPLASHVYIF